MTHEPVDRSHLGKGEYANYFEVGHDFVAFYLDCGQAGSRDENTRVYSRIITTPVGACRLAGVLAVALCKYARLFGPIRDEDGLVAPNGQEMEKALCDYAYRFGEIDNEDEESSVTRMDK